MRKAQLLALSILLIGIGQNIAQDENHGQGLIFADEEEYKNIPLASTNLMGTLPEKYDLSGSFPIPGNQGRQASCVGWAVGYGLKSYQETVERGVRPTDGSLIFSPSYLYNQIKAQGCYSGSHIVDALNYLRTEGILSIDSFPYNSESCNRIPTKDEKSLARRYAIVDWRRVDINNEAEVKGQIAANFPIVIGMYIDESFRNLKGNRIWQGRSNISRGGHAMVVVGYDDSRQAYKVLNSWGTVWGDNGYGWISYAAFPREVREGYTAHDIIISQPNHDENDEPFDFDHRMQPLSAVLQQPIVHHNQMVQTPNGMMNGMILNTPGVIINGMGKTAQLIIRFYQQDMTPLFANYAEPSFRDINGLVAVGTPQGTITANERHVDQFTFAIPYYALNFIPTNGMARHVVHVIATLYVDNFEIAKSPSSVMTVWF